MARRLVERGVRFVQLYIEGQIFDSHSNLQDSLKYACGKTDKPIAALLKDLKQRGLLDSTLVVYGGEFGRLPMSQGVGKAAGRDHGLHGRVLSHFSQRCDRHRNHGAGTRRCFALARC